MRRLVPAARDASDDEPTAPGRPDAVVVPAAAHGDDEAEDGSPADADQPLADAASGAGDRDAGPEHAADDANGAHPATAGQVRRVAGLELSHRPDQRHDPMMLSLSCAEGG